MRRLRFCALLAASLLVSTTAFSAEFTPDEMLYFQRIQVVSQMNGALWNGIENQRIPDTSIVGFARKVNSIHLAQIRSWGAPTEKLTTLHTNLEKLLTTMDAFYGAVEGSDDTKAKSLGDQVHTEMRQLAENWKAVAK